MGDYQPDWRVPRKRDLTDAEAFVAETRSWPGAKALPRPSAYRDAREFYDALPAQGLTFARWWGTQGSARYDMTIEAALVLATAWRDAGAPRGHAPDFADFWFWVALRHQADG